MKYFVHALLTILLLTSLMLHGGVYSLFKLISCALILFTLVIFKFKCNRKVWIFVLVLSGLCFIQLIPSPLWLHKIIAPSIYSIRDNIGIQSGYAPMSIDTWLAIEGWLEVFNIVFLILLSAAFFAEMSGRKFFKFLFVIGFLETCYALYAYFFKADSFIFSALGKRLYTDFTTGSFVNRNHFGFFVSCIIPFGIYFSISKFRERRGWFLSDQNFHKGLIYSIMTLLMFISAVLSKSRGALLSLTGGVLVMFILLPREAKKKYMVALVLGTGIGIFALVLLNDFGIIRRFLEEGLGGASGRLHLWKDTFGLIWDNFLVGISPGSFLYAFEKYNVTRGILARYQHPHNEYLAFLADFGVVIGLAIIIILALLFLLSISYVRRSESIFRKVVFSVFLVSLINFIFDFNLRIPTNAMLFAFTVGYLISKTVKMVEFSRIRFAINFCPFVFLMIYYFVFRMSRYDAPESVENPAVLKYSPSNYRLLLISASRSVDYNFDLAKLYYDAAFSAAPYNPDVNYYRAVVYYRLYKETRIEDYRRIVFESTSKVDMMDPKRIGLFLNNFADMDKENLLNLIKTFELTYPTEIYSFLIINHRDDIIYDLIDLHKNIFAQHLHWLCEVGNILNDHRQYETMLYLFTEVEKLADPKEYQRRFPQIGLYMVKYMLGVKDYDSAIDVLKRLIKASPDVWQFVSLSEIYNETGNKGEMLIVLERAAVKYPLNADILKRLAESYYSVKMFQDSLKRYVDYVSISKDASVFDEIVKLLKTSDVIDKSSYIDKLRTIFEGNQTILSKLDGVNTINK
ncbi:MAG: O-antigen ligase family protein [Planctomycetes bacterium]|nr:O-antigen ligase family protein [Planctomycetota bacterium]